MKSLVILPVYNERKNLEELIPKIFDYLPQTDILFIDDHSEDGSTQHIKSLQMTDSRVFLIERPKKMGLGSAYLAGFEWGLKQKYDIFFEMDADGSHPPKKLTELLEAIQWHDVVLGSRYIPHGKTENWNFFRRSLSRCGNIYAKTILGLPYSDLTGGFKCFKAKVLQTVDLKSIRSDGYCFQIEVTYRAHQKGFRIQEIPITFSERHHGKSKISRKIIFEALVRVPLLRITV